jgi:calcium/calmodulin-dependent protein kinase I
MSQSSQIKNINENGSRAALQAAAGSVVLMCGGVLYIVDPETSDSDRTYKNHLSIIGRNSSFNIDRQNNPSIPNSTNDCNSTVHNNSIYTTINNTATTTKISDFNTKKIGRYTFGKVVGQGSFGVVRSAVDLDTGKTYAIKELDLNLVNIETVYEEINILKKLGNKHKGICSFYDIIEKNDKVYIVFDFVKGVAFDSWISENGILKEERAQQTAIELLKALKHVHECGIIHRDVKPENILVKRGKFENDSDSRYVLIDFGMAVKSDSKDHIIVTPKLEDAEGTFAFWAPEMMRREPYGPEVDLWALGVSLYCIMCGIHPFDTDGKHLHEEIYRDVISGNFDEDNVVWRDQLSKDGKDFISKLLNADSVQRMSCQEALEHPWLK